MIRRCVRAVARIARLATLTTTAVVFGAGVLSAQATAKIEGRVRDTSGQPIANAQVFIVGTAFSALSNPQGYYFINNVPLGTIAMRAAFVGYQPVLVNGVQVQGGQTMTQDFSLKPSVTVVSDIVVTATQPLVPRDQVTSKSRIDGAMAAALPVDRIQSLLALQPGVVASATGGTMTIRGGRTDEAITYLDGVPTQAGYRGFAPTGGPASAPNGTGSGGGANGGMQSANITVNSNGLQEATITTGASNAEFGNAQSGVIDLETRSGGPTLSANIGMETDQPFSRSSSLGYTKITGGIGGPIPSVKNLTFYVSGLLEGQQTSATGFDGQNYPIFVPAGVDTTVAVASAGGNVSTADTSYVPVEKFAEYRGSSGCDFGSSANAGIASNYGQKCYGAWAPRTANSNYQVGGKLAYSYGTGSRLQFSVNRSQSQGRNGDLTGMMNPTAETGFYTGNNVFTLNWNQNLSKSAEKALALESYISYQQERVLGGPLTRQSELDSRDPFGGFMVAPLQFDYNFQNFPLNDQLIDNYKNNTLNSRRTPYDLEHPSQYQGTDLWRNNAYGVTGYAESGPSTGVLNMYSENRILGRANLDWQADRFNRIKLGGEYTHYDAFFYSSSLNNLIFSDVWHEKPVTAAGFITDRLDLGDVVIDAGLRYDYFSTGASRPYLLDGDPTSATYGQYEAFPRTYTYPGVDTINGVAMQKTVFREDPTHGYLSPHIQVAFPVTQHTNFRLSYAHQVQTPDFGALLGGINTDLQETNTNQVYGNDLGFGKTITFEFGVRHEFNEDMVLDISAYNKDKLADAASRLVTELDPQIKTPVGIRLLTSSDFGNTKGIDVNLQRRFGNLFTGSLNYTYSNAKNTGSDPNTYINFGSRIVDALAAGGNAVPPQAILNTAQDRTHNLAGVFSLNFPDGWRSGTTSGRILQRVGVTGTFRYASGTPFTACSNTGANAGTIASDLVAGGPCSNADLFASDVNGVRLPAIKTLDMKFTKGFKLGRYDLTAYVDARNILNFQNILAVYVTTNDVSNAIQESQVWAADSASFAGEANASGVRLGNGDMDLTFGGAGANGCGGWVVAGGTPAAPNCVYLIRAEQRWGNGDGIFSLAEQHRASDAQYQVNTAGLNRFTGAPRRVRVGFEINF